MVRTLVWIKSESYIVIAIIRPILLLLCIYYLIRPPRGNGEEWPMTKFSGHSVFGGVFGKIKTRGESPDTMHAKYAVRMCAALIAETIVMYWRKTCVTRDAVLTASTSASRPSHLLWHQIFVRRCSQSDLQQVRRVAVNSLDGAVRSIGTVLLRTNRDCGKALSSSPAHPQSWHSHQLFEDCYRPNSLSWCYCTVAEDSSRNYF